MSEIKMKTFLTTKMEESNPAIILTELFRLESQKDIGAMKGTSKCFMSPTGKTITQHGQSSIERRYKITFNKKHDRIEKYLDGFCRRTFVSGVVTVVERNVIIGEETVLIKYSFSGEFFSRVYKSFPSTDIKKIKIYLQNDKKNTSMQGRIDYTIIDEIRND